MRIFTNILLVLSLFFLVSEIKAQINTPYSQYVFNKYMLNPATAGSEGISSFNLTSRKNWLGINEAPGFVSLSAETRILRTNKFMKKLSVRFKYLRRRRPSGRVGLGAQIFTDYHSRFSKSGIRTSYSYHLPLRDAQLSFGMSLSVYQDKINLENALLYDTYDPIIENIDRSKIIMNGDMGIFYTNFQYYAGYSMMNLYQRSALYSIGQNILKSDRTHILMGGYRYTLNRKFDIEGNVMFRMPEREKLGAEINVKGIYLKQYWAGISYRTTNAIVVILGAELKNFYAGYAFDWDFNDLSHYEHFGGSHEITLGYNIGDKKRRYKWLYRF
jgi:type IX secretion system PorP/SprF family membrane protein